MWQEWHFELVKDKLINGAYKMGFPGGSVVMNPPAVQEMQFPSLGQ